MAETSERPSRRRTVSQGAGIQAIARQSGGEARTPPGPDTRPSGDDQIPDRQSADGTTQLPQRVAKKYFIHQGDRTEKEQRLYADARGEYLVIKDQGHRLTTHRHDAGIVRDMVAIAEHRAWQALEVTGSAAFRRAVWLEASARGLEVSGYAPRPLDRAALARRSNDQSERDSRRDPDFSTKTTASAQRPASIPPERASEADPSASPIRRGPRDDAVRSAPHRAQDGGVSTRGHSGAADHGRFLSVLPSQGIEDARLAAGYSHVVVLDRALRRAFPDDATKREMVLRIAGERVAYHLNEGRTLQRATYKVPIQTKQTRMDISQQQDLSRSTNHHQRIKMKDR